MNSENRVSKIVIGLLFIFHLVGIWGMSHPELSALFKQLTSFNLLFSTLLLGVTHKSFTNKFITASILIFCLGYGIEVLGVQTGVIFGVYAYGKTLGFKLIGVPLAMGLNWLLLIYGIAAIVNQLKGNFWIKSLIGAGIMVLLDMIIEPVAIKLDFWNWAAPEIPLQNYLAWFIFSAIFFRIFFHLVPNHKSLVGKVYILVQFLFFGALLIRL